MTAAKSDNRPKTDKRKPPRSAFKPGQSGNPGGRPKKDARLRAAEELAREHTEEAIAALIDEATNGKGAPRVSAAIAVLDRGWGRAVERQEAGKPGAFNAAELTDEQLAERKKRLLEKAVKSGAVSMIAAKRVAKSGA